MTEWEALKEECLRCQACTLAATRTNVVFGVGSEDAEVLFIGAVSYTHLTLPTNSRV